MNHYSEHVLEMYVVGSEKVESRRQDIELHLRECHGCRTLVSNIREFYGEMKEEYERNESLEPKERSALVPVELSVTPLNEPFSAPVLYRPQTFIQKIQYYLIRYPVRTVAAGVASSSLLYALTFFALGDLLQDRNPAIYNYNNKTGYFEVFNKGYNKLWELPILVDDNLNEFEIHNRITFTKIADLNGDKVNEVATTIRLPDDEKAIFQQKLRVFDSKKNLIFFKGFNSDFQYLNRRYDNVFTAHALLVEDFTGAGKNDIIVSATSIRSPMYLQRIDAGGNVLGEYWHFGQMNGLFSKDITNDGINEIVAFGIDDALDSVHVERLCIVVLDGTKISGKKKSTVSQGFAMPFSDAEILYLQFPICDMNVVLGNKPNNLTFQSEKEGLLTFSTTSNRPDNVPDFHYLLSNDMKVVEVKSTTATDRVREQLIKEGKLKGSIDKTYLENLKNEVQYWNGTSWQKSWTKVNHSLAQ
ncbi:MAG: hypothetical protein HY960_12670 [Ignavibacteriae bacterium]|nr:hypothetical protein [Ignavibacteriota bacterium]